MQFTIKSDRLPLVYTIYHVDKDRAWISWDKESKGVSYGIEQLIEFLNNPAMGWDVLGNKEIIGYKAPIDLFRGRVKAGQIYKVMTHPADIATPIERWDNFTGEDDLRIPREIVESWEPVYGPEQKTLLLGDKKVVFKVSEDGINADGTDYGRDSINDLQDLYNSLVTLRDVGGYAVTIPAVQLGCTSFTLPELKQLLDTYYEFNIE